MQKARQKRKRGGKILTVTDWGGEEKPSPPPWSKQKRSLLKGREKD